MIGPVLFLLLPVGAAAAAYGLRRWRNVPPLLVAGVSLALGLIMLLVPLERPITLLGREVVLGGATSLLGRELVLGPAERAALAFLFLTGAGLFLLAWQLEPEDLLPPLGMGLLGLLGGVLLVRPLVYAALLLQIGVALSIFPLHADPRSPVRGGLRYLTFFTLALPGLLISHWLLDMYVVTPDQVGLLTTATALIGFSFALMLGVVPFHPWVPAVARDGAPLASAFLFSAVGGAVWFLYLDYLQTYTWLTDYPGWSLVVHALGVITVVVGGLLGTTRRGPGVLLGYAVLVDTGMQLVALGQASRTGVDLGVAMVLARAWGATLMAAGLAGVRARSGGSDEEMTGVGLRAPWSTAALVVGGLSLAGFPPTIGFAPRWGLYRLLFRTQPVVALALLLASAGPVVGLLRLLRQLLRRPAKAGAEAEGAEGEAAPEAREPLLTIVLLVLFIFGVVGMGLFPQALTRVAVRVGSSFTIFGP